MQELSSSVPMCTVDGSSMLYPIRKGDTLAKIVSEQYNVHGSDVQQAINSVLANNPEIKDPNMIYAGQMLILEYPYNKKRTENAQIRELLAAQRFWNAKPKTEQAEMAVTTRAITALGVAKQVTQVGGTTLSQTASILNTNKRHYFNVGIDYSRYTRGEITKSQYDYRRRLHLSKLQANLGPLESSLHGNNTVFQKFRMAPGRSNNPTAPFLKQIDAIQDLTGKIKRGGTVLSYIMLPFEAGNIALREKDAIQREIKLTKLGTETLTGAMAGAVTGRVLTRVVVGVALATTPVGWGAALVIGLGSIVAGEIVSHYAGSAYEKHLSHIRIADVIEEIEIPDVFR
ncbi:hypothetical protein [Roseibium sp.]|uniref:hypothetical protein n=1 Tax=Roseibium sp. TaxID=1936156 RepID=UPI003B524605